VVNRQELNPRLTAALALAAVRCDDFLLERTDAESMAFEDRGSIVSVVTTLSTATRSRVLDVVASVSLALRPLHTVAATSHGIEHPDSSGATFC
jgi:hypothetical protein